MRVIEYVGAAAGTAVIMSHSMRKRKVLFVESNHDAKLFDALFSDGLLPISARGASGVVEAVEVIDSYNSTNASKIEAVGFIDKDYLHLKDDSKVLERTNIITTEYRDIEIDLLHSEAFRRLLEEKASSSKWQCENKVVEDILMNLSELSLIRAYNAIFEKSWDFKDLDLIKYTNTSGELNYEKLLSFFRQKNRIDNTQWEEFENWKISIDLCLKNITRGHDAVCVFGQMLRRKLGNRRKEELSCEIIEENLRLAVERKFVEIFNWFNAVYQWVYNQANSADHIPRRFAALHSAACGR